MGVGDWRERERQRESQIKVVKRRRTGGGEEGRNNRRVTDQIPSDRTREEDRCTERKREGERR